MISSDSSSASHMGNHEQTRFLVPDVLAPGLDVVFCGTAPSVTSASRGAYYAYKHNKFWSVLHQIGLTDRQLEPEEYPRLLEDRIGLTDLCKTVSGNDDQLPKAALDRIRIEKLILELRPSVLAFTSKTAGRIFMGRIVEYGRQPTGVGSTVLHVLPSTSPRARRRWDVGHWHELAKEIRQLTQAGPGTP